jgi:hypothetical protein
MRHVCAKKSMQRNNTMTFSSLRWQRFRETLAAGLLFSVLAVLAVPAMLGGRKLLSQTQKPEQQEAAGKPRRRSAAHAYAASNPHRLAPEAIVAPPPALPAPIWPADQPPNPATVRWDIRGLEIEASNSSLDQILHRVATDTGAKLEGLTRDQRIFGSYGPGPACDVLSKLLDGSGYNVLMIGSRGADAPLQIILSARSPASPKTGAHNQNRSNSEDEEAAKQIEPEPPRSQLNQNPFANGESPRDPVQFMQEILQRQQKIDQQQQQDQQDNLLR